jgi:hypothetical protein
MAGSNGIDDGKMKIECRAELLGGLGIVHPFWLYLLVLQMVAT